MRKNGRASDRRAAMLSVPKQIRSAESVVPAAPLLPEEKDLHRLYKTIATTVWRMRKVIMDPTGSGDPRESLDERGVLRMAKYLETLDGVLEDARIQIKGDYEGCPYDEGDAVKVVTFEERKDLSRDEYVETLLPTVRWIDKDGKANLLQQAEVVVGKATASEKTN